MNQRQRLLEQIRQQSIQKRAQALREAAQKQANNAPIACAAAGASSGGGRATCPTSAGIGLYIEFSLGGDLFGVGLIPLEYLGQQNGRPSYGYTLVPGEFESYLQFDPEAGQWQANFGGGDDPETVSSYSDQLVSSDWSETTIPDFPIEVLETTCGFPDLGRYCITFPAFGVQAQPFPSWFGEPESLPALWQLGFGIIGWLPALDPNAPAGWLVSIDESDDLFIPGGSQDQIPLGEFELAPGFTIVIAEGTCDF